MNQDRHKNASPPLHAQSESWPLSTTGFNTEGVKMWEVETVVLSLIPLSHYVTCITEFKWASAPSWEGKSCPVFCSPIPSGLSLQKDLIWGMHVLVYKKRRRCEPYREKMNIWAFMLAWLYSVSMHTSELQAVMMILPPRFSCTVL